MHGTMRSCSSRLVSQHSPVQPVRLANKYKPARSSRFKVRGN